jgi:hypothetical protein
MVASFRNIGVGRFKGHETNIVDFDYSEGSTPHVPGDDSGSIGELSLTVLDEDNRGILLYGDDFVFTDAQYGSLTGTVSGVSANDNVLSVSAFSRLNRLNVETTFTAEVTNVRGAFRKIFDTAGIFGDIIFSPDVPSTMVNLPGFTGNLWTLVKQMCSVFRVEVSLLNNVIFVRPIRTREINLDSIIDVSFSVSEFEPSEKFDVAYYNYEFLTDSLAFPRGGWNPEVPVYTVEANETIVFDIPVDAYLESVKQPVVQNSVSKNYVGPDSVYSVSGNDGLPVSAAFWSDFGGDMRFDLKQNGTVIEVTLTGPNFEQLSPYTIGVSDGATQYSTLRVVGTGMFFDRQVHTVNTGLPPSLALRREGQEVDIPVVDTLQDAIKVGIFAKRQYALPVQTVDLSARQLFRRTIQEFAYFVLDDPTEGVLDQNVLAFAEQPGVTRFLTFDEYNQLVPSGFLFSDFNDSYFGSTFTDFELSVADILRQNIGSIVGARVRYADAFYRVRSANYSQSEVNVNAEFDTIFDDFNNTFNKQTGFIASGGTVTADGSFLVHTFTSSGTFTVTQAGLVEYLVVAGGGGGGGIQPRNASTGGGGGGGVLFGSANVSSGPLSITVGAGGAGGIGTANPSQGGNSAFGNTVATGGGRGGGYVQNGGNGGSGGGAGAADFASNSAGGSGVAGQGNNGGRGGTRDGTTTFSKRNGGGGGGAGQVGQDSNVGADKGGNGGNGIESSITGTATYYAGGGGGGAFQSATSAGAGGLGGGADGTLGVPVSKKGVSALANTGGGGGGIGSGSGETVDLEGGDGGSGIVIIRYTPQQTFDDFAEITVGLTFNDYALIPLRDRAILGDEFMVLDTGLLDVNILGVGSV